MSLVNLVLGPLEGLFGLVGLAMFGLKAFALVDGALRPERFWAPAGVPLPKMAWMVILTLSVFFGGLGLLGIAGLVAAIVYLVDVRPKVREIQGRGSSGPYGQTR